MFGEFCPHPKFAKHEKPNRTPALPLSERPSERGVKPNDSEASRCKHHVGSPPKRAGYTNDLKKRLKRHNDGLASKYTKARLPVTLVWKKEYHQFKPAFKTEQAIKNLTRMQKETLVNGKRLDKVLADAEGKRK